jgi:hypothetical protein
LEGPGGRDLGWKACLHLQVCKGVFGVDTNKGAMWGPFSANFAKLYGIAPKQGPRCAGASYLITSFSAGTTQNEDNEGDELNTYPQVAGLHIASNDKTLQFLQFRLRKA